MAAFHKGTLAGTCLSFYLSQLTRQHEMVIIIIIIIAILMMLIIIITIIIIIIRMIR